MNRTQQDLILGLILALEHESEIQVNKHGIIAILRYVLLLEQDAKSPWMGGIPWKK
ncbi:MAG: hypothetical protein AABX72_03385 [Nanoarchaeota archaeon]